MEMKEQIREMDQVTRCPCHHHHRHPLHTSSHLPLTSSPSPPQELERYHKNNSALELTISDLKLKLEGMQREILSQRSKLGDADSKARGIKTELHECIQHVQDPKALKDAVKKMYQRHAADDTIASKKLEEEIAAEYSRQREYLEKSVESLKRKLNKNMELHRSDNMRMMSENVALIKEINELRREIKGMKMAQRAKELGGGPAGSPRARPSGEAPATMAEAVQQLDVHREEVRRLRNRIDELEAGSAVAMRPVSRERLPVMDGMPAGLSETVAQEAPAAGPAPSF